MSSHDSSDRHIADCHCQGPAEAREPDGSRDSSARRLSRRGLLRATVAGAAAGVLAGTGLGGVLVPRAAADETALTPEAALQMLMDGNERFIARELNFLHEDLAILQANTVEQQVPFASVLSCADSRVPVELLFDQSIGHVFVNRVAGNIATAEIIASIEFGVAVLGTRVLMVLGHSGCGAVSASISAGAVPGQISALYPYIRPAVDETGGDFVETIKANARIQARLLSESSPVVAEALGAGTLKVVAAYYDLASGRVSLLGGAHA